MTRRLRVGYVIGTLDAAGSERQLLALAERLPADQFAPEIIVLSRPGMNAARAAGAGIPVHVVPPPIRRSETPAPIVAARLVRKVAAFARLVRRGRYDILDAWLFHAYVLAAVVRPVTRLPVLVSGRRSLRAPEAGGRANRLLQRLALSWSDAVVANSPQVRDEVLRTERVDPSRLHVIRNGVDLPAPADAGARVKLREELRLAPGALAIGTVANLLPGKGHDVLLGAAAEIAPDLPEARFVLVGDGHQRQVLEHRAAALGIADRVSFVGAVPDATRVLPAFDIIVHPSLAEGMPNAVLEAAAAGLPIVATAVGGSLEVVREGETGLLAAPGDASAIAVAVRRLAADPELRGRLGSAARAHVAAAFGMDRFVGEFADLYVELARRRGIE